MTNGSERQHCNFQKLEGVSRNGKDVPLRTTITFHTDSFASQLLHVDVLWLAKMELDLWIMSFRMHKKPDQICHTHNHSCQSLALRSWNLRKTS